MRFKAPTALDYFASLVAEDASLPLTEAAVAIALTEHPDLDVQGVLAHIDELAHRMKRRLAADAGPLQRLRLLNRFYFDELGFAGNVNHYDDPSNSFVHAVLETRRGIPISLAVVYLELAGQIGLSAHGVSFPGHFLVKLRLPEGEAVIDPFTGHSLTREALDERLLPYRRSRGPQGDMDPPLALFLQAATAREVLARMLRNLKEIHHNAQDWARLVAVLDRWVLLLPHDAQARRDRGLAHAELGQQQAAVRDLSHYLQQAPAAADRRVIAARLATLKRGGGTWLH